MNTSGFYRADDAEIERMTDPILAAIIEKRRESRERLGKFVFSFVEHPLALPDNLLHLVAWRYDGS